MDWLLLTKEALGLGGSLLLSLPWFWQYGGMLRVKSLRKVRTKIALREELVARRKAWLEDPRAADLVCTLVGLALLAASFAIGVAGALDPSVPAAPLP